MGANVSGKNDNTPEAGLGGIIGRKVLLLAANLPLRVTKYMGGVNLRLSVNGLYDEVLQIVCGAETKIQQGQGKFPVDFVAVAILSPRVKHITKVHILVLQ